MLHFDVNREQANKLCDYNFKHLLNIAIISIKTITFSHMSDKSKRYFRNFVKNNEIQTFHMT